MQAEKGSIHMSYDSESKKKRTGTKPYPAGRIYHDPAAFPALSDSYQLIFILSGSFAYTFAGRTGTLSGGQIIIVHPQTAYALTATDDDASFFGLCVTGSYFENFTTRMFPELNMRLFDIHPIGQPEAEKAEYLRHLARRIAQNIHPDASIADRFLFLCIAEFQNRNDILDNNLFIEKFLQKLEDPQYLDASIDELCMDFPYSHSMLLRYFRKYMNTTIVEYRAAQKMKLACRMLKESDDKIIDIATALHYNSLSHFLRAFKTAFGMTPSEYRRKHRPSP